MFKKLAAVAIVGALAVPMTAQAAMLHNTTGLTGSFNTETFDTNAGDRTAAAGQFAGITFGAGNFISNSYSGVFPNMSNSVIANFDSSCCASPTSMSFGSVLSEVAFNFVSNPQSMTFAAYLGATLVDSFTIGTNYDGDFYGFTGINFDSIRITGDNQNNNAYILDNLQSKNGVPEPGTLAILGLGLAGLAATRRRQS